MKYIKYYDYDKKYYYSFLTRVTWWDSLHYRFKRDKNKQYKLHFIDNTELNAKRIQAIDKAIYELVQAQQYDNKNNDILKAIEYLHGTKLRIAKPLANKPINYNNLPF